MGLSGPRSFWVFLNQVSCINFRFFDCCLMICKFFVDFFVRKKKNENFSKNKKYIAKVIDWGNSNKKPEAQIIKCIGERGQNETEINSIIYDFNLPLKFPKEVIEETENLNEKISEKEINKRKDLSLIHI